MCGIDQECYAINVCSEQRLQNRQQRNKQKRSLQAQWGFTKRSVNKNDPGWWSIAVNFRKLELK